MRVGFVTCVHPFYELPAVVRNRELAVSGLRDCGCEVIACGTPRTPEDAVALAAQLRKSDVDAVLLFFCTWVSEEVTLALAGELMDIPMLMWALPYLDRDIPMPSPMSGLVASASNIRRLGKRFAYMIGHVTGEMLERCLRSLEVAAVATALRRSRFGIVGGPCPGMVDVEVDEAILKHALGVSAIHFELGALLHAAWGASPEAATGRLLALAGGMEIDEETLAKNLRLYAGMRELVEKNRLDAYCVRCWPELRDQHKITMCAAHVLMSQDGIPNSCEVDLPALVTTFLLSRLAGSPAFNFDITAYLENEGALQLAHCGAADPRLARKPRDVRVRSHMRTGTGATVEFPFKEGAVTLAKLMRPVNGRLKLFVASGRVIPSGDGVRGSVATVRPESSVEAFLDKILREGVEHHIALVYGSWQRDLEQFCDFTGVDYLPLS